VSDVTRGIFTLYVHSGGDCSGTNPTLDCRVQGAPTDSASMYTMVKCYSAGAAATAGPVGGVIEFAQATTAVQEQKFSAFVPRYLRAIATITGDSPVFNCSLWVDAV